MSKWTEIVDGKRVAIQGLLWNSHQVFKQGEMTGITIAIKEALEEANFKEITGDLKCPIKLGDIKGRYSWGDLDLMALGKDRRIHAAMKLKHNKKVFLLRAYLGQGKVIRLSWRPEGEPMMYMERTLILRDGSFSMFLDELFNAFRNYWKEVEEASH